MKKNIRLTESDLNRLVRRVIMEQNNFNPKPDSNAVNEVKKLIDSINKKDCVPVYQEGNLTRLSCRDKSYYTINHYRKFGQ